MPDLARRVPAAIRLLPRGQRRPELVVPLRRRQLPPVVHRLPHRDHLPAVRERAHAGRRFSCHRALLPQGLGEVRERPLRRHARRLHRGPDLPAGTHSPGASLRSSRPAASQSLVRCPDGSCRPNRLLCPTRKTCPTCALEPPACLRVARAHTMSDGGPPRRACCSSRPVLCSDGLCVSFLASCAAPAPCAQASAAPIRASAGRPRSPLRNAGHL